MRTRIFATVAIAAAAMALGTAIAEGATIRVQSTTDTVDAGLVEPPGILRSMYAAAQPGDTLSYVGVGTGAALDNARAGLADVVITHAPTLEQVFVNQGYSLEGLGRQIFYSDYVIVGPINDPANVLANHPHDAIGAFEEIAAAGAANTVDFISRANNSGTSVQEQIMWGLTSTVPKAIAADAGGDNSRFEPTTSPVTTPPTIPSWYHRNPSGQAANLNTTNACSTATFPSGKCYTLIDRGTFNKAVNAGTVTNLKIVADRNTPNVRGGQDLLINPFSAYVLNPDKTYPNGITPNSVAGKRLVDFIVSPAFQAAVDTFPTTTDPAFHSDAFPRVTLTTALPPTAAAGATVAINATLSNRLPGAPAISGLPVTLQKSTDGGATYASVGGSVGTSASGAVSFSPTVDATTSFRLSIASHPSGALSPNAFTQNTQDIGVVSVAGSGTPPPPATTPPPPAAPAPAPDKTAPRVTSLELAPRTIAARISEAATVRFTIAKRSVRRVRRNGRTTRRIVYTTARTVTAKGPAGQLTGTWAKRLSTGTYRVKARANDAAGNVSNRTVILSDLA